jgi:hypothetical protein
MARATLGRECIHASEGLRAEPPTAAAGRSARSTGSLSRNTDAADSRRATTCWHFWIASDYVEREDMKTPRPELSVVRNSA